MKSSLILIILFISLFILSCSRKVKESDIKETVESINSFSFELLSCLEDENNLYSPYSINTGTVKKSFSEKPSHSTQEK
jgi:outer membrane lipoprotein-sorting protein